MLHVLEPDVDRNFEYDSASFSSSAYSKCCRLNRVLTSAKFVRHADDHLSFLAQTFVANVSHSVVFTIYSTSSPHGDEVSVSFVRCRQNPTYVVVSQLFYFSVAMMTTAGIVDVYPRRWFTQLLAASQMLLSVLFTIVVLGRGVSRLNERRRIEKSRLEMYAGAGVSVPLSLT